MIIQIEVQPETAALLNDAQTRGISIDALLRETLRQAAPRLPVAPAGSEKLQAFFEAMAEGSERASVLPPATNERAFYYEERE